MYACGVGGGGAHRVNKQSRAVVADTPQDTDNLGEKADMKNRSG